MSVHYDSLAINRNIILDLPLREGIGALYTHDISKPHHQLTMVNAPAWTILDSYLNVLTLDGALDYIWGTAVETADFNFTSVDYSMGIWMFISSGGADDKTVMCRFLVSNNGWELYHYTNQILTMRHHHAAGASPRTAAYSENWAFNKWWFMGLSRHGGTAQFWRGDINGFAALPTTHSVGGLIDPEPCTQNFFIGTDTTSTNDFNGLIWRPRIWFERYLSEAEWQQIWEKEVEWFRS